MKPKWNKNKLSEANSQESTYLDYINLIINKTNDIKETIHDEIKMEAYYDIQHNREKVMQLDKLQRVHKLLNEIEKILIVKECEDIISNGRS